VNYLERKLTYHINTLNKTIELYVEFNKNGKEFTKFIEETCKKEQKLGTSSVSKEKNEKMSKLQV